MSRRKLRPEELDLWRQVARSAEPLRPERHPHPQPERGDRPSRKPDPVAPPEPIPPFKIGSHSKARSTPQTAPPSSVDRLRGAPVTMDAKSFGKLKRGKLDPESRLDLHGMTLDAAHGRLNSFILTSQTRGLRLVLVITGKGDREDPYAPAPQRRGVLKRQVPIWLKQAPLGSAVLQIAPAHIRHGGEGALYVYLRRRR